MTIQIALDLGAEAIGRHEARILLSQVTGLSPEKLIIDNSKPLDENAKGAFFAGIGRRQAKEPLQYIIGRWEFMRLEFITDARALIPRQETEILVEDVLAFIHKLNRPVRVLDVCTGSGCIAVAVAKLAGADVTAIDISTEALSLAKENAMLHGVDINFMQGDLLNGLELQTFDVIISNPPYIPTLELCHLQAEIGHEPRLALDGGADGLDLYRRLVPASLEYLAADGALFLEIGPRTVEAIMLDAGYGIVRLIKDYAGLDRVLIGHRR